MHAEPQKIFLITVSVSDAAIIKSNGTKSLLANCLSIFAIKGKPNFSNGPRSLPRNLPAFTVLGSWVFEKFVLADEPFAKAYKTFSNLCGILIARITNHIWRKIVTWVLFFVSDFNLLNWKLHCFTSKMFSHFVLTLH